MLIVFWRMQHAWYFGRSVIAGAWLAAIYGWWVQENFKFFVKRWTGAQIYLQIQIKHIKITNMHMGRPTYSVTCTCNCFGLLTNLSFLRGRPIFVHFWHQCMYLVCTYTDLHCTGTRIGNTKWCSFWMLVSLNVDPDDATSCRQNTKSRPQYNWVIPFAYKCNYM